MAKEKVILAYSGGLDTTAIIPWLKENYDYDVVCCCVDCGQGNELDGLEERAKYSGAAKLYIEDITDEFCDDYIIPCVQAGAVYENKYLLGTSMCIYTQNTRISNRISGNGLHEQTGHAERCPCKHTEYSSRHSCKYDMNFKFRRTIWNKSP